MKFYVQSNELNHDGGDGLLNCNLENYFLPLCYSHSLLINDVDDVISSFTRLQLSNFHFEKYAMPLRMQHKILQLNFAFLCVNF